MTPQQKRLYYVSHVGEYNVVVTFAAPLGLAMLPTLTFSYDAPLVLERSEDGWSFGKTTNKVLYTQKSIESRP